MRRFQILILIFLSHAVAYAQSFDTATFTRINVRECQPAASEDELPICGGSNPDLADVNDFDLGILGASENQVVEPDLSGQSAVSVGYSGDALTPTISAYSYAPVGQRIIASGIGIQRYEFLADGILTGTATLTYSQSGQAESQVSRHPRGVMDGGIIMFQTDNGTFDPMNCPNFVSRGEDISEPGVGTTLLICLITQSYEGGSNFQNVEITTPLSDIEGGTTAESFSISGSAGDVYFLSSDLFVFANNGGFGDARTTLSVEFDNPELVAASFAYDTFALAPPPVVNEFQKLLASDGGASDVYGVSVAIDNNELIIGAPQKSNDDVKRAGAAYIYTRDSSGSWTEQAKLWVLNGAHFDHFGQSVGIDANTAIVGAPFASGNPDGRNGRGAAYIYARNNAGEWLDQETLLASDAATSDKFGFAVAVDGETVVVGAPGEDSFGHTDNGAIYVYTRDNEGNWTEQIKLIPFDAASYDGFGNSVAIDGELIAVGASLEDSFGHESNGAVYVFTRDIAGRWTEQAKIVAGDATSEDFFGVAVDVIQDTLVVGAVSSFINSPAANGAAYIYERNISGDWIHRAKLQGSDAPTAFDNFGYSVALDGNSAVVGAFRADANGTLWAGGAYVYMRNSDGQWHEHAKLLASDRAAADELGTSVSISSATAVVSAPADDDLGGQSGSAYIFHLARDSDADGYDDSIDNCPSAFNPNQLDSNGDGFGDACVDPSVTIPNNADVDPSVMIGAGAQINSGVIVAAGVEIGAGTTINRNASIGEDTSIGANANIAQGVSISSNVTIGGEVSINRDVTIEDNVYVGDRTVIGRNAIIGAGSRIGADSDIAKEVVVAPGSVLPDGTVIP